MITDPQLDDLRRDGLMPVCNFITGIAYYRSGTRHAHVAFHWNGREHGYQVPVTNDAAVLAATRQCLAHLRLELPDAFSPPLSAAPADGDTAIKPAPSEQTQT